MNGSAPRSCVPVAKIEDDCYDWTQRHELKRKSVRENQYDIVFIGDSITHFWCGESGADLGSSVWHKAFDHRAVLNLGYGYDRTQNVLWRISNGGELDNQNPSLFVVNIGTNQFSLTSNYDGDTPEVAAEGVRTVWRKLHEMFPHARIVAMALFPRGGKSMEIAGTNELLKRYAPECPWVTLLDIGGRLGDESGNPIPENYQPDLCHLAVPGYRIWADALTPFLPPAKSK